MNKIVIGIVVGVAVSLLAHGRHVPAPRAEPAAHVKVPGAGYHLLHQCCSFIPAPAPTKKGTR
jgi:hypothetical protein